MGPVRRRFPLGFCASLGPHQQQTMTSQVSVSFRGERLIVPFIRRGRFEALGAWLFLVTVENFLSLLRRGSLYWRLGPKAQPVSIDRITVDKRPQLPGASPIPAEVFTIGVAPAFDMDPAGPGTDISITVTNRSRKPFFFRCTLIGSVEIKEGR